MIVHLVFLGSLCSLLVAMNGCKTTPSSELGAYSAGAVSGATKACEPVRERVEKDRKTDILVARLAGRNDIGGAAALTRYAAKKGITVADASRELKTLPEDCLAECRRDLEQKVDAIQAQEKVATRSKAEEKAFIEEQREVVKELRLRGDKEAAAGEAAALSEELIEHEARRRNKTRPEIAAEIESIGAELRIFATERMGAQADTAALANVLADYEKQMGRYLRSLGSSGQGNVVSALKVEQLAVLGQAVEATTETNPGFANKAFAQMQAMTGGKAEAAASFVVDATLVRSLTSAQRENKAAAETVFAKLEKAQFLPSSARTTLGEARQLIRSTSVKASERIGIEASRSIGTKFSEIRRRFEARAKLPAELRTGAKAKYAPRIEASFKSGFRPKL